MILRVKYMNFKARLNILQEKDEDTSHIIYEILVRNICNQITDLTCSTDQVLNLDLNIEV
jgi:hypothetical protein